MSNRLTKQDLLEYVAAVPPTPYIPARRVVIQTWSAPWNYGEIRKVVGDPDGGAVRGDVDGDTYIAYTTVPAQPATPGTPAYTIDNGVAMWNAGASSTSPLSGNGAFRFQTSNNPGGVVCGLTPTNVSTLPHECSHAIHVSGAVARVMEYGVVVHTFPTPVDVTTHYILRRTGTSVQLVSGADVYNSDTPITTAKVYLDAALFLSGDFVDNPELYEGTSGLSFAAIGGVLPSVQGVVNKPPAYLYGVLPALQGIVYYARAGAACFVSGSLPPMTALITGVDTTPAVIQGALRPVRGVVKNYAYSFVEGSLPMFYGSIDEANLDELFTATSRVSLGHSETATARIADSVSSTLRVNDRVDAVMFISDVIYDALPLVDWIESTQSLEDAVWSVVQARSSAGKAVSVDLPAEVIAARAPTQYGVNVSTSAASTYQGMDFDQYAMSGGTAYGSKADGVYVLRGGDDNGQTRSIAIDFGAVNIGTEVVKTIEAVYLGVNTDGQVFVRLKTATTDHLYRVLQRGSIGRALSRKGVGGRYWNVSLEVVDASYFELDMVEVSVSSMERRWSSR